MAKAAKAPMRSHNEFTVKKSPDRRQSIATLDRDTSSTRACCHKKTSYRLANRHASGMARFRKRVNAG
jgi:hypothetical protein